MLQGRQRRQASQRLPAIRWAQVNESERARANQRLRAIRWAQVNRRAQARAKRNQPSLSRLLSTTGRATQGPSGPNNTSNQSTTQLSAIPIPDQSTQQFSVDPNSNQSTAPVSGVPITNQSTLSTNPNPTLATQQLSVGSGPVQPTPDPYLKATVTQIPTPTAAPNMRHIEMSAAPGTQINVDPNANQPTQPGQSAVSVNGSNAMTNQQTDPATNSSQSQLNITGPTQTRTPGQLQVTGGEQIGIVPPANFKDVSVTNANPGPATFAGQHTDVHGSLGPPNTYQPIGTGGYLDTNALQKQLEGPVKLDNPTDWINRTTTTDQGENTSAKMDGGMPLLPTKPVDPFSPPKN